ncbi:MAG: NAD(P)/FAD-dependent oxidoreductase [Planctomycetota bacterium]
MSERAVIIGGGPAGLAAGYECGRRRIPAVVLEADSVVGGLCRTVEHNGFRFDLGGHRFFTKSREVSALWHEILGDEFLRRPRLSRIYFGGRFVAYPLKPLDALRRLGLVETARSIASYLARKLAPNADTSSFESWNENQFGRRLYTHFFKAYTEKVWGIPCSELASEWGAQRIKGLSLASAIRSALFKPAHGRIKTLIEEFEYPRLGPGEMYEALAERCRGLGVEVLLGHRAVRVERRGDGPTAVHARTSVGESRFPASAVLSSMPLSGLVEALDGMPPEALSSARALTYRSLLTVNLMLTGPETIPETWLYIHDPAFRVGRVQCFKNWSPFMVPKAETSSLGMEFFATEGDDLWTLPDHELVALGKSEMARLGIADEGRVFDAFVLRAPKAYPVFRLGYAAHLARIREVLDPIPRLYPIGRYGMFRYNNMDHSILTGLLAARCLAGERHDLWSVNADEEYLEAGAGARAGSE